MKNMILAAFLIFGSLSSFAAGLAKEARPATLAEARTFVESRKELKEYKDAATSKKLTPALKENLVKFLSESTSTIGGIDTINLENIAAVRPETLVKIVQLITLNKNGNAEQKSKSASDLKILSEAGKYEITKTEAEALEKITEMADYNSNAKDFKSELISVLKLNKAASITEAVTMASKGKITLDKIKDCII